MKWLCLAILIGAVVLAALPVAADDVPSTQIRLDDMQGDWHIQKCLKTTGRASKHPPFDYNRSSNINARQGS